MLGSTNLNLKLSPSSSPVPNQVTRCEGEPRPRAASLATELGQVKPPLQVLDRQIDTLIHRYTETQYIEGDLYTHRGYQMANA